MDGWQVRVNCEGEMVVLQTQPPAWPTPTALCSCGLIVCGAHFLWGYLLPPHSPSKHLFIPCYLDKCNHGSHINTLLGARC